MGSKSTAGSSDQRRGRVYPGCAATANELRRQHERMKALAPTVSHVYEASDQLTIEFAPDFDRELLDETLAVERVCCPFFGFRLDDGGRRLTVTIDDSERRAALEALSHALGVSRPG